MNLVENKTKKLLREYMDISLRLTNIKIGSDCLTGRESVEKNINSVKEEYIQLTKKINNDRVLKINKRSKKISQLLLSAIERKTNAINIIIHSLNDVGKDINVTKFNYEIESSTRIEKQLARYVN